LCGSRKHPYPPKRLLGIPRMGRVSTGKLFKEKYESKLEFP